MDDVEKEERLNTTVHFHVSTPSWLLTFTMGRHKPTGPESKDAGHPAVAFPRVGGNKQPRALTTPFVLKDDQIVLYPNALTAEECRSIINLFENPSSHYKLEPSPLPRKGEALRTNERFSQISPEFAKQLYEKIGIQKEVASWPSMFGSHLVPIGLSSNIRIYRYQENSLFSCHYDDHSIDPHYGPSYGKSEWTVLFYLTGEEDGVLGGQTVFYTTHIKPKKQTTENTIQAPLMRGAALFHRHGKVSGSHCSLSSASSHLALLCPPGMYAS